jgi:hypothetical protein
MEQIDVVKKGSTAWVWIVIAIAAVALLLWLMMGGGNPTPQTGQIFEGAGDRLAVAARLIA